MTLSLQHRTLLTIGSLLSIIIVAAVGLLLRVQNAERESLLVQRMNQIGEMQAGIIGQPLYDFNAT
jgi:hypothetical protein